MQNVCLQTPGSNCGLREQKILVRSAKGIKGQGAVAAPALRPLSLQSFLLLTGYTPKTAVEGKG